ncbi:MAG: transposase [Muribaculaceae bacterium]|nr:transposase [Muribaculaceae bacterium]
MTIPEEKKRHLYRYIYGILKNKGCLLYRINGTGNHIHILMNLHQSLSLASTVQSIKQSSNLWMKRNSDFASFEGWGKEYYADSKDRSQVDPLVDYIMNQEMHHNVVSYEEELEGLYAAAGFEWNPEHIL